MWRQGAIPINPKLYFLFTKKVMCRVEVSTESEVNRPTHLRLDGRRDETETRDAQGSNFYQLEATQSRLDRIG